MAAGVQDAGQRGERLASAANRTCRQNSRRLFDISPIFIGFDQLDPGRYSVELNPKVAVAALSRRLFDYAKDFVHYVDGYEMQTLYQIGRDNVPQRVVADSDRYVPEPVSSFWLLRGLVRVVAKCAGFPQVCRPNRQSVRNLTVVWSVPGP